MIVQNAKFNDRVSKILSKLENTLASKNQDYGDSYARSVDKYGPTVTLIRLSDKFNRLENLILNPNTKRVEESIEDTLLDLAGYAILELERRAREKKETDKAHGVLPAKSVFEELALKEKKPPYADLDD